jgi:hypothetical protein
VSRTYIKTSDGEVMLAKSNVRNEERKRKKRRKSGLPQLLRWGISSPASGVRNIRHTKVVELRIRLTIGSLDDGS